MLLKPKTPWLEFAYIGIILSFSVRIALLFVERRDVLGFLAVTLFFGIGVFLLVLINRRYRTIRLDETLQFSGYFWGNFELKVEDILEFRIKEVMGNGGGPVFFTEDFLIIYRKNQSAMKIMQDNYEEGRINEIVKWLSYRGIRFLGREPFSWKKSFQDLLKGKIFE